MKILFFGFPDARKIHSLCVCDLKHFCFLLLILHSWSSCTTTCDIIWYHKQWTSARALSRIFICESSFSSLRNQNSVHQVPHSCFVGVFFIFYGFLSGSGKMSTRAVDSKSIFKKNLKCNRKKSNKIHGIRKQKQWQYF